MQETCLSCMKDGLLGCEVKEEESVVSNRSNRIHKEPQECVNFKMLQWFSLLESLRSRQEFEKKREKEHLSLSLLVKRFDKKTRTRSN